MYNPSSNSIAERANRRLLETLRTIIVGSYRNRAENIEAVQYSINSTHHKAIKATPNFALYGRNCRSHFDIAHNKDLTAGKSNADNLFNNSLMRFEKLRDNLRMTDEVKKKGTAFTNKTSQY